jgi:5-methyltetrahydrofolate--homocysteine methyltransferase
VTSSAPTATAQLRELLEQRIVVLDGAWGTMLQRQGLTDADYRGERFRDHPRDVAGDPDLLNPTRPDSSGSTPARRRTTAGRSNNDCGTPRTSSLSPAGSSIGAVVEREVHV